MRKEEIMTVVSFWIFFLTGCSHGESVISPTIPPQSISQEKISNGRLDSLIQNDQRFGSDIHYCNASSDDSQVKMKNGKTSSKVNCSDGKIQCHIGDDDKYRACKGLYFPDSLLNDAGLSKLRSRDSVVWSAQLQFASIALYTSQEPLIGDLSLNDDDEVYRLLKMGNDGQYEIMRLLLNGSGCRGVYKRGRIRGKEKLRFQKKVEIPKERCADIKTLMPSLKFWESEIEGFEIGKDGHIYLLEGRSSAGLQNIIGKWGPSGEDIFFAFVSLLLHSEAIGDTVL